MTWKIEKWMEDVFPGEEAIYSEYRSLPPRELVIVCAAVFDIALAELLFIRLGSNEREAKEFLGINGDGRAPAGSFGARIQLALLTGIITERDAAILRKIKALRNLFAHHVKVTFLDPKVVKICLELCDVWEEYHKLILKHMPHADLPVGFSQSHFDTFREVIPKVPQAGEGLVLALLAQYQAYFHRLHSRTKHIDRVT